MRITKLKVGKKKTTRARSRKRVQAAIVTQEASHQSLFEQIQKKAYELFESRGYEHGHADEDWIEAERIVRAQLN